MSNRCQLMHKEISQSTYIFLKENFFAFECKWLQTTEALDSRYIPSHCWMSEKCEDVKIGSPFAKSS